ncbi:putative alpha-glucan, water dikinase [Helianthus anomalus]
MAVLVQKIINADYAFVIHTTNSSTGDPSEIYAEIHYVTFRRKIITFRRKIMIGIGKSSCNYPN